MKKRFIITVIAIILLTIPQQAKSQETTLLFYDFETWDGTNPEGWAASLNITIPIMGFPIPLDMKFGTKNNVAPHEGNFDLQISPYHLIVPGFDFEFIVPAFVQLGSNKAVTISEEEFMDLMNEDFDISDIESLLEIEALSGLAASGVAISENATHFRAFYRFFPAQEADSAKITVKTTRWDPELNSRETVAKGTLEIGQTISNYKEIITSLVVEEGMEDAIADTVFVRIVVGNMYADEFTKLFIDNFSLLNAPGLSITKNEILQYPAYPNPATETLNIIPANPQLPYSAKLFDISGRLLLENNALIHNSILDIKNIARGIYLLELIQNGEKYTQKIVIQ